MIRKIAVSLLLFAFLLNVSLAQAQQQTKVFKIGFLSFRSASDRSPGRVSFRQEFRALGYIEGKNIIFEIRSADGNLDRFLALADELVRLKVDILLASSTTEALVFKNATKTIPIVFIVSSDPVLDGLIDSLARPGRTSRE